MQNLEDKMKDLQESISTIQLPVKKELTTQEFKETFLPRKKYTVTCPAKCGGHVKFMFRLGELESSGHKCHKCFKTFTFKREVKTH